MIRDRTLYTLVPQAVNSADHGGRPSLHTMTAIRKMAFAGMV